MPTPSSGVASNTSTSQKPVRPSASRVIQRSSNSPSAAPITGEKNRTPNSVSPQIVVLSHCAQAIIGGLL